MTGAYRKMNKMKLAENAHQIRTEKALIIREVARAAGLSVGAVHSIESAKGSPRIVTLERLAGGLGVQLMDLIGEERR
jgi:transcriptional regulator with XRE-family HTH domain